MPRTLKGLVLQLWSQQQRDSTVPGLGATISPVAMGTPHSECIFAASNDHVLFHYGFYFKVTGRNT